MIKKIFIVLIFVISNALASVQIGVSDMDPDLLLISSNPSSLTVSVTAEICI